MHILAIANALSTPAPNGEGWEGVSTSSVVTLKDFEELSHQIHQIVKLEPSSAITMSGFYQAGGVSAVLKTLLRDVPLFKDTVGVALEKTSEIVKDAYVDTTVIHNYNEPFTTKPGLGILYGNISLKTSPIN